jgi:hypothetical protein
MAFNPFGQSSLAQSIINGKLTNITSSTPMQPQDMNTNNVFRNPYSPTGFYANNTDVNPKPSFTPPTTDDQGNKQCDNFEGYYYDPISDSCKLIASETMNEGNDPEETKTFSERAYDSMARDVTDPYGSSNEIQKYFDEDMSNNSVNGDKYYDFDSSFDPGFPNPLINLGLQFGDKLFGGPERRTNRFRTALDTMRNQTPEGFQQGENSMGKLNMFGGQTYLDRVGNLNVNGNRNINNLLNSMRDAENRRNNYDSATGQTFMPQGTPIAEDMSGSTITGYSLRNNDGTRNDTNYQATVAKNIAKKKKKNKDSNRGGNASKFSEKLGGFYGGR